MINSSLMKAVDYKEIFAGEIKNLVREDLFNTPKIIESPIGSEVVIGGKKYINLCSNNYLGFANNPILIKAAKNAIDKWGVGPAAVRTIAGTTALHLLLEDKLKKFKKVESVITYQSGFMANLAVIPSLVGEKDIIFSDELNHASIIDACKLSKAQVIRYLHADFKDLEEKLKSLKNDSKCRKLIVTDGVFSMDGDIAPLPQLHKLAQKHGCMLMVDDAHGEGVLGKNGRGIVDHFDLHGKVDIEIGTLSKAFGVVGGFAAGKKQIIDWLRQRSRPFLFSSAMTPADTVACIKAVEILEKSGALVKKLYANSQYLKKALIDYGFDTGNSKTPIVPIMLGEAQTAKKFSGKLFEKGVFAVAVGFPTVPMGKARIRVMVSAGHTRKQLEKAAKIFAQTKSELNL